MRGRSLLSKTLWQFMVCIAANFALATPLFYLLTKHFYAEDMIDIIEAVERGEGIPPLDLERDIMAGMMLQFLLIFLVVSLSLFITMRFVTRRLWMPFDDTLRKAEHFNLTQEGLPDFTPTDIREFRRLNHSLQQLMSKAQETFRIQKEFTENASHELQTPLAVIRSKLDLLMQEELSERQMHIVSDLYELTMRMGHLNRNLLLLAKIDNAQFTATEEVDIADTIARSAPLYDVLRQGNAIRVENRRTAQAPPLHANPILLECLLKNLIANAIRHSATDSTVGVLIEDHRLTVSNASTDHVPLDAFTLFRRFRSGGTSQKGNGLGLAIVKAICDLHGWSIHYHFSDNEHRFVVGFPKSTSASALYH